jgi:hypothetical protein
MAKAESPGEACFRGPPVADLELAVQPRPRKHGTRRVVPRSAGLGLARSGDRATTGEHAGQKLLMVLMQLAMQADEDCPPESRTRHFSDALEEAYTAIAESTGRVA